MPLWMRLLMNAGVVMQEHDGEGNDLGGGQGGQGGNDDDKGGNDDKGQGGQGGDGDGKDGEDDPNKQKSSMTDKEAELLKEVMKRKEKERKLQEELDTLRKQVGDLNLDEVRQLLEQKKQDELKKMEERGEFDRIKQQMVEEHNRQQDQLKQQIADLQKQLSERDDKVNELSIGNSFSQSNYIANELTLTPSKARALYGAHFELEDGQVVAYDKPRGAANRTVLVDGAGNPLSFDKAMQKIIEADPDRDSLIRSKFRQGSGSHSKQTSQPKAPAKHLSPMQKIQAGLEAGNK